MLAVKIRVYGLVAKGILKRLKMYHVPARLEVEMGPPAALPLGLVDVLGDDGGANIGLAGSKAAE